MKGDLSAVLWTAAGATALAFLVFLACETVRPLRRQRDPKGRRVARNLTAGGISLAVVTLLQTPFLLPAAKWAAARRLGLLNFAGLAQPVQTAVAVVLLDYTLWIWHRINHVVPFFWRFHLVHHVDRDMDASTAFRFHFGEQGCCRSSRWESIPCLSGSGRGSWPSRSCSTIPTPACPSASSGPSSKSS